MKKKYAERFEGLLQKNATHTTVYDVETLQVRGVVFGDPSITHGNHRLMCRTQGKILLQWRLQAEGKLKIALDPRMYTMQIHMKPRYRR